MQESSNTYTYMYISNYAYHGVDGEIGGVGRVRSGLDGPGLHHGARRRAVVLAPASHAEPLPAGTHDVCEREQWMLASDPCESMNNFSMRNLSGTHMCSLAVLPTIHWAGHLLVLLHSCTTGHLLTATNSHTPSHL